MAVRVAFSVELTTIGDFWIPACAGMTGERKRDDGRTVNVYTYVYTFTGVKMHNYKIVSRFATAG
jgi:hypothetical protein